MSELRCVVDAQAMVGEGPVWNEAEQTLYWIDVKHPHIHQFDPQTGINKSWPLPERIGCMVFADDGRIIAATKSGFHWFDAASGMLAAITDPESDKPGNRFNDGKCDSRGRLFAGTMDDAEQAYSGTLYRLDGDFQTTAVKGDLGVSNGLGWSPDDRTMYFTDSMRRTIWSYDYDIENGSPSNQRTFAKTSDGEGAPDGLCVDSEGYVWSAHWGGWRVTRYAPDGSVDRVIEMPVPKASSCCFGGADLTTLYVTTARVDIDAAGLEKAPLAGGLFAIDVGVRGLPSNRFRQSSG